MVAMPSWPDPIVCIIPMVFIMDMLLVIFFMSFIMPIIGILPMPPCAPFMSGWLAAVAGVAGTEAGAALSVG